MRHTVHFAGLLLVTACGCVTTIEQLALCAEFGCLNHSCAAIWGDWKRGSGQLGSWHGRECRGGKRGSSDSATAVKVILTKSMIYKNAAARCWNGLKEMWKRFSEIEVSSWSRLKKYIITISVHINMRKHKKALRSSWSRLLDYITTVSCHNDESAAIVVADDASSSSLLLLLSAAGHNASEWAPIEWLVAARNWIRLYGPLSHLVMHA